MDETVTKKNRFVRFNSTECVLTIKLVFTEFGQKRPR